MSLARFSFARGAQKASPMLEIPKFESESKLPRTRLLRLEARMSAEPKPRDGLPVYRMPETTLSSTATSPAPKETWMPFRATSGSVWVVIVLWRTLPVGPASAAQSQPENTMPVFWKSEIVTLRMSTRGRGTGAGSAVWMMIPRPATWLLEAGLVRRWVTPPPEMAPEELR